MNEKIDEIFLERILIDIQRMEPNKCLSTSKKKHSSCNQFDFEKFLSIVLAMYGMQLLDYWCRSAEQSSIQHKVSSSIICDSCQNIYLLLVKIYLLNFI